MDTKTRIQFFQVPKLAEGRECLLSNFALSKDRLDELIRLGAIYCDKIRWNPQEMPNFRANSILRIHFEPKRFSISRLNQIQILENQKDFVAIWKPAGVPSHATLDNQIENAKTYIETKTKQKLWGLSRLDVGTRGVLLFAKSSTAAGAFNSEILPSATKIYECLTEPSQSLQPTIKKTWVHWMKKSDRAPRELSTQQSPEFSLLCELEVHREREYSKFCFREIRLITGRTHQIRAQMAFTGSPILGDRLYGSKVTSPSPPHSMLPPEPPREEFALSCESLELKVNNNLFTIKKPASCQSLTEIWTTEASRT